jgi:acyl carrier protein
MAEDREERIVGELRKLIIEELDVDAAASGLDPDAPFFEGGLGIDSIAIVVLIAATEQRFAFQFTDHDLVASSFASIRTLARLIAAKPGVKLPD